MSDITLRQLNIFVHVVEQSSFRQCAEEFNISPVSVGEHVKTLESRLSCTLFIRQPGRRATLTESGKTTYEHAKKILADVTELKLSLGLSNKGTQQLNVVIHPFLSRRLLGYITEFKTNNPDIVTNVEIKKIAAEESVQQVQQREVDLAYFLFYGDEQIANTRLITEEPMAIFVGKEHPLTRLDVVQVSDLLETNSIHLAENSPLRVITNNIMASVGINSFNIALETGEYGLLLSSVRRGLGYVCMFESNASEGIHELNLGFSLPKIQVLSMLRPLYSNDSTLIELEALLSAAYLQG